jgi:TIR domain
VQFGVSVPPGASGPVIATLSISLDSAPLGHVKFKTTVDSPSAASLMSAAGAEPAPQGELARRYQAAFISYASKDRDKVLERVQMLPLVGVRYFQDLLNLEPGDRWLHRLELGIDECDLFLLFWSSEAKSSQWVRQEVRHALERRGGDDLAPPEIKPVIIEGPPLVEPWEELAHLHFNDRVLYFMNR